MMTIDKTKLNVVSDGFALCFLIEETHSAKGCRSGRQNFLTERAKFYTNITKKFEREDPNR